ncbi:MAG: helicase HerA-like domain-containing protein [Negativicutes bacterium]
MPEPSLFIAKSDIELHLLPKMANRHGLITGATGTGKTITLQRMAESFSAIGTPVFLSDIKGDLSGICAPGGNNPKIEERIKLLELKNFRYHSFPVQYWDVFGEMGFPVRTTISEMGPLLLSRLLDLNEVQSGVLNLVFRVADDQGLLLLDLKDLKAMLVFVAENAAQYTVEYGSISKQSVGAIQRALLIIEEQGGDQFFGEPSLDIHDFMKTDSNGLGMINILACDKLFQSPALYSTFLLWLLSELFEELPEVGDLPQPKMVFFFDEAHLLFNEAPKVLLNRIEQVVRLIRSKGVGVYFITQNPVDIPDSVLGQLGNRVQHALRAYTPKDQKAIKAAAETFRQNPKFTVEQAVTELGTGEALISFLDEKGRPNIVEKAFVLPPYSLIGPISADRRKEIMNQSVMQGRYERPVDRESAYELLQKKAEMQNETKRQEEETRNEEVPQPRKAGRQPDTFWDTVTKTAASTVGRQVARELVRGILGSFLRR